MTRAEEIEQCAATWLARREDPDWTTVQETEFQSWLGASDAHKVAYWRLEHGWRAADRIGSLGLPRHHAVTSTSDRTSRLWAPIALAASVLLVFAAFALSMGGLPTARDPAPQMASVETAVGARKTINLSDGSRVELNTASVVRAELGSGRRAVWLDEGEAYFDIAKREGSPFIVHAGSRQITVLGTKFGVRLKGDNVIVSVAEGRVRVDDMRPGASIRSTTIGAGEVAIANGQSTLITANSQEQVEERLAWRHDQLVFDDAALDEVVAEFNRYNRRRLVIDDPAASKIRIGGSFHSKNVDAFVRLLREAYDVDVEVDAEQAKIST